MTPRQVRVVRGAAASVVAVLLAAVSHTYGGADAPAPLIVAAVAVLAWPLGALLAATRWGIGGLAATAVLAQLLLHAMFAVTAGAPPAVDTHHSAAAHTMTMTMSGGSVPLALPDAPMLTAHLIAALAAVLVLGYGERMLYAVLRWLVAAARRGARRLPAPNRPRLTDSRAVIAPGPLALRRAPLSRRGPPRIIGVRTA
jgi:hypothetical protein